MSKQKVVIKPISPIGSEVMLTGIYPVNGIYRKFTPTYEVLINPKDKDQQTDFTNARNFFFNKTVTEVVLEYDEEKAKDQRTVDYAIKNSIDTFFRQHPNILVDGDEKRTNIPKGHKPEFIMEVVTERANRQAQMLKDKNTVTNRVLSMSQATKANVMDYFGYSPVGMDDNALLTFLVDPATGALMKDEKKRTEFLKVWMGEVSRETEMAITVRKAIRLDIIMRKPNGQREDFFFGTTHIGTSEVDCIDYFRKNPTPYDNHIVREVQAKDEPVKEATKPKAPVVASEELIQLRTEACRLRGLGFIHGKTNHETAINRMSDPEKLKSLIEQGQINEKAAKKYFETQPQVGDTGAPVVPTTETPQVGDEGAQG